MSNDTFYAGTVYTGVVGSETENGFCRDSIHNIIRRPGDSAPIFIRATKGYEARQMHINKFMDETEFDFLFLLDHDMIYQPDSLERLRNHGRAYVTGAYMRRTYNPIAPVWFKENPELIWPFEPDTRVLSRDRLHPAGASGWGCVLIHRDVITAVRQLLKGEPEVIEDDMDVWPYDLGRVMEAIQTMKSLDKEYGNEYNGSLWTLPQEKQIRDAMRILTEEIRPLRGTKDPVGSDIRFPFFARVAGYKLWLDPNVRPGHMLNYPLSPDDFDTLPEQTRQILADGIGVNVANDRRKMAEALAQLSREGG